VNKAKKAMFLYEVMDEGGNEVICVNEETNHFLCL
jgi:hypothetical protein